LKLSEIAFRLATRHRHIVSNQIFPCGCIPERFVGHYRVAATGLHLPISKRRKP